MYRASAYIFLNGVSCGLGVGDAILYDGSQSMFPVHSESAGGWIVYLDVPWATTGY